MASRFFLPFFICQLLVVTIHAQSGLMDTSAGSVRRTELIKFYQQKIGSNSVLYNAPEYIWTYPNTVGHPYFLSDTLQAGILRYDGIVYHDVPVLYEMVQQTVVMEGYQKIRIRLTRDKIESFSIAGHFFEWVRFNDNASETADGFYEVLSQQKGITALARRRKEVRRSFNPADPDVFKEFTTYLIRKGEQYFTVDSERSLLEALSDKRTAMRKFLRENRLNFKREPVKAIVQTVEFYANQNN